MSYKPSLVQSPSKKVSLGLEPTLAWIAILGFALITMLGVMAGAGNIMNLLVPAVSVAVAVFLYFRAPLLYTGFTWWMWFLAPFVRRVSDFRGGFTDPSPMLLAPYAVCLVSFITLVQYLPKAHRIGGLPFVLSAAAVIYGFLIGMINRSPFVVVRETMDWLAPVAFGFHLFVQWRDYPNFRQNLQRVFLWGVLIMGVYGVIQFMALPDWDRLWLFESNMVTAAGRPDKSGGMRVWSTMQSGEPFAAFMAAALLLILTSSSTLSIPASIAGYLTFLLAMVRSAWIGWFAGMLTLLGSLKVKFQIRLLIMAIVLAISVVPLATTEPFSEKITGRLESLSNVQQDNSAKGRQSDFQESIVLALASGIGQGIGGGTRDSAILSTLFDLGWLGTLLYIGGLVPLIVRLFLMPISHIDPFIGAARAVVASVLVRIPVNGTFVGVSGVVLWTFIGLSMAASRYYEQKHRSKFEESSG